MKEKQKVALWTLGALIIVVTLATGLATSIKQKGSSMVLRHVVLFKFSENVTPEDVREIETAFAALPSKIPQIIDFEWGTDVSIEGKSEGYTHCFFVTFGSEEDRAIYLPHPEHKKFGEILRKNERLQKVLVFDYWTQN